MTTTPTHLTSRVNARLVAYTTMAGAALAAAAAPTADANVVYSGPLTLAVPQNGFGIYLDLATGATAAASFAGYDINFYGTTALTFFRGTGTTLESLVSATAPPSALPIGTNIGPTSTFTNSSSSANFQVLGTEYLGLRFTNTTTGAVNYGWIQLVTGAATTGYPATIVGYAFEDTGASILAGQITAIPEPATVTLLGVMAAGAVGMRQWRRRRAA